MDYNNYFVNKEKIMTLNDIEMYARNKDIAYVLIKKSNKEREDKYCLEKVVVNAVIKDKKPFDDSSYFETRISVIKLNDGHPYVFLLRDMGDRYVFLKSKPGEEYIKASVEILVARGEYCKNCKYWSNVKMFSDGSLNYHDGSCFLFLKYLDYDREIGEMIKCEECKRLTN